MVSVLFLEIYFTQVCKMYRDSNYTKNNLDASDVRCYKLLNLSILVCCARYHGLPRGVAIYIHAVERTECFTRAASVTAAYSTNCAPSSIKKANEHRCGVILNQLSRFIDDKCWGICTKKYNILKFIKDVLIQPKYLWAQFNTSF